MPETASLDTEPFETLPSGRSGAPSRTCSSCGVRSTFPPGSEPDWSRWSDGVCPSCVRREARSRFSTLDGDARDELVLELLRDGVPPMKVASMGINRNVVLRVKRQAIRDGLLPVPDPLAERRERRPGRKVRTGANGRPSEEERCRVGLELLREHPAIPKRQFITLLRERLGRASDKTLEALVRRGAVVKSATREPQPGRAKASHVYRVKE